MLTLYHNPMNTGSRFARLILAEYGIEFELVEEKPWLRRREFVALNPAGTLPVLIAEAEIPVCGAVIIGEYVDETRGALKRSRRLLPENPLQRAEVRRLTDWFLVKFDNEAVRHLVRERIFKLQMAPTSGGGSPDASALRAARTNIREHMKYLEWLAATRDWLGGDQPSYADMAAAASVSLLDYMGEITWADHRAAKDWYARMKSRRSFRPLLADRVRWLWPSAHYSDLDF